MITEKPSIEAMILVGGSGTRLRSVVSDRPKPMALVAGRPFVEWLVVSLSGQGVGRVVFCTGYLGEAVEAHFGDGHLWDVEARYSRDPFPLGTAGAVRHALDLVKGERFLVLNGDSYCRPDVELLARTHKRKQARATIWLVKVDDCSRYGSVEIGEEGVVRAFREKQPGVGAGFINAGIYFMERSVAEAIPAGACVSLENEVLPQLVGCGLYAVAGEGPFVDIGTPESYASSEHMFSGESFIADACK